jgi:hypothetical protein
VSPGDLKGDIWQSGNGPAADCDGNVYVMTADGNYDPQAKQFGDSFLKLSPDLSTVDWFTPAHPDKLNILDIDLGSAVPMLLPEALGVDEMIAGEGASCDKRSNRPLHSWNPDPALTSRPVRRFSPGSRKRFARS